VPCVRLSWPFHQLLSARKYIVSYRIVKYRISAAANRMLGFRRRTLCKCLQHLREKSYKAIVRPKLEAKI